MFFLDGFIEVLGEATNSRDAFNLINKWNPDLAIVDLRLGEESGLEFIKAAIQKGIICKFVVLTSSIEEADFQLAKEIGVDGYLLKEALPEELLHALS